MPNETADPVREIDSRLRKVRDRIRSWKIVPRLEEYGEIVSIGPGIARVEGLPGVRSEELVILGDGVRGLAIDLREQDVGVVLLDEQDRLSAGDEVRRTRRVVDAPVGKGLFGRVVDAIGRPLDDLGEIEADGRRAVERPAPAIMDRAPVQQPLKTGIKAIDALIPIGRGQRQLIVGDRQTGKTAIALDTIINQKSEGVRCVYCAIGQRASSVARLIDDLRRHDALEHTVVVSTTEEDQPGLRYLAPYTAMTMAERIMQEGDDALVIFDDLSRHARAYRELSLLLRRPPGREAYPGDIFYIHSRLLERSTHLKGDLGGGSVTALPIVETQAQNISAYIPTNLISITDGQIYLSPQLFQRGVLPAIDVGRSVSRVGGKTQYPAYRSIAGELKLSYSQFEELESFSRFASRLDEQTRKTLEHGRRVREILKQPRYDPIPIPEQIAVLFAVEEGLLDELDLDRVPDAEEHIRKAHRDRNADLDEKIRSGESLSDDDRERMREAAKDAVSRTRENG